MPYNPDIHHRRSVRIQNHNYAWPGAYFVTICAQNRACLFGEIVGETVQLNDWGAIASRCWQEIPEHFTYAALDAWVVMPNHVHGVIVLQRDASHGSDSAPRAEPPSGAEQNRVRCFGRSVAGSLATIVMQYKAAVTRQIRRLVGDERAVIWQRSFYDHIIRDPADWERIAIYIQSNPILWDRDKLHPESNWSV